VILQPGSLFAGYRIDHLLGSGAMGVVYQGYDLTLDRVVAIKVLGMILVTPEDTERFRVEARVLARFTHPHILPVFTCGVEQDAPGNAPVMTAPYGMSRPNSIDHTTSSRKGISS
jgi:serine/threonine-protein kinase